MDRPPPLLRSVADLRTSVAAWRSAGRTISLVPTMGALHEGHLDLVRHARGEADIVVVSIFVNPRQFGPQEDFSRYPRTEASDAEKLAPLAVEAIFAPDVGEMYADGFASTVTVAGPAEGLETDFRPHFFAGVATVVAKLLLQCLPDVALFGEKDYQQLKVIERMARDLDMPLRVLGVPTVREADGLALSSRNVYLSPEERARAPILHSALRKAGTAIAAGRPADEACAAASEDLERAGFAVDYVAARNADTLAPLAMPGEPVRLLAAARLGATRLIDNIGL